MTEEQVAEGITLKEQRPKIRKVLLEAVPLLCSHFDGIKPDFVNDVAPQYYSVGRNLMIPLRPTLIYGVGGKIYFPWFSFWRSNPLCDERLSLFITLVDEMLLQDPDLEDAKFEILDFSASTSSRGLRQLNVIDCSEVPKLKKDRLREMLSIFVEGFEQATKFLEKEGLPSKKGKEKAGTEIYIDINQAQLFD